MILLVEVSEPAGQAQGGQAALSLCCPSCSQACIYPGSCSSPLFPPCRLLQDFLSVPLQPALICAPSAPAGASEPCPATRLVSPVSLVSLLHQDALWLCSPACLTSPSTLSALPLIFYLLSSAAPAEPCPTPGGTAVWASRPRCSCILGRIPPSHLTGCRGACAGLGHRPAALALLCSRAHPIDQPIPERCDR